MSIADTLDNEDRAIMRQALSGYSRAQRETLRQFIDLLIAEEFMRQEHTLQLLSDFLDEARAKRQGANLRVVEDVGDGDG